MELLTFPFAKPPKNLTLRGQIYGKNTAKTRCPLVRGGVVGVCVGGGGGGGGREMGG